MKRLIACLTIMMIVIPLFGCSKTSVRKDTNVSITFVYEEKNICVLLKTDEAERVVSVLDDKHYAPLLSGSPSCGFDQNISVQVGDRSFAIATDTCNIIQDLGNLRYFEIPKEDMAYIHALFESYGGYFPCV